MSTRRDAKRAPRSKKRALLHAHVMPDPGRLERPTLELDAIRTDGGTQPRERLDESTLADYAERMSLDPATGFVVDPEGQRWPELVVFFDGQAHWLADGFHRYSAAQQAGLARFQVTLHEGALRDAVLYSLGVNATHGKRRTNADKRRALTRALTDEQWRRYADSRLAALCKVSAPMVRALRSELEAERAIPFEPILYGSDGREFERSAPTLKLKPSPVAAAAALPSRGALAINSSHAIQGADFAQLAQIKAHSLDLLIAYPSSELHWAELAEHASRVLHEESRALLIAHLPSSTSGPLWAGPARLDLRDAFASSHLLLIASHRRHYALWSRDARFSPGVTLAHPAPLLKGLDPARALTLGTPLDLWM